MASAGADVLQCVLLIRHLIQGAPTTAMARRGIDNQYMCLVFGRELTIECYHQ